MTYSALLLTARNVMFFGFGLALLVTIRPLEESSTAGVAPGSDSNVAEVVVILTVVTFIRIIGRTTILTGSELTCPYGFEAKH